MFKLLFFIIVIVAGIILGPLLAGHQGYVLIQTENYNIETSLTASIIMLIILIIVILAIIYVIRLLLRSANHTYSWFSRRNYRLAHNEVNEAYLKFIAQDYQSLEKLATRRIKYAEVPLINYLIAAIAAQKNNDHNKANSFLEQANNFRSVYPLAYDMTYINAKLAQGEFGIAEQKVDYLIDSTENDPEVLKLAEQIYLKNENYTKLLNLLPKIEKNGFHDELAFEELSYKTYNGYLNQLFAEKGIDAINDWWHNLNRKLKQDPHIQFIIAKLFLANHQQEDAYQLIVKALKNNYSKQIASLLYHFANSDNNTIDKLVDNLIKKFGQQTELENLLGYRHYLRGEWEQAITAFQSSLNQRCDLAIYEQLADCFEKLQQLQIATEIRQKALKIAIEKK